MIWLRKDPHCKINKLVELFQREHFSSKLERERGERERERERGEKREVLFIEHEYHVLTIPPRL